jgi:hypothetical protein
MTEGADVEFKAMHTIFNALDPLSPEARARVIAYITSRLEIDAPQRKTQVDEENGDAASELKREEGEAPKFESLAELFDAASPKGNASKALVAAYWLQVCLGTESFEGFTANKELKNLGEGIPNITDAIDGLRTQKPSLVIQLKKSGTSRQARKTYKVTVAGIKAVENMIAG